MSAAQLHPISACGERSPRASPSPGQPPGVAAVSTGGGSHRHSGPGHCTALMAHSLRCQHGVRSGQAPGFRRMRASRVISCGREGWSQTCLLSSGPASTLVLSHHLLFVTTRPVPQSFRCGGQQDRRAREDNSSSEAPGTVSATVPLGNDSPQDQSHHPGAAIAPSAD